MSGVVVIMAAELIVVLDCVYEGMSGGRRLRVEHKVEYMHFARIPVKEIGNIPTITVNNIILMWMALIFVKLMLHLWKHTESSISTEQGLLRSQE